ncbi:hypothetical protein ACFV2Q_23435 [Streptomyces sp. NPDC059650]|uniref:hypothetical protein n=1 Tax=Streptomyces sp. NPDC059650 TaxID=3346896 RepID=UPI0036C37DAE
MDRPGPRTGRQPPRPRAHGRAGRRPAGFAKQFTATLLDVPAEASSTRGVLVLRNASGELEQPIRTDRGDPEAGRAVIERARALIGPRVRVYRLNERMASNPKL